jgi:hypothetical protein
MSIVVLTNGEISEAWDNIIYFYASLPVPIGSRDRIPAANITAGWTEL